MEYKRCELGDRRCRCRPIVEALDVLDNVYVYVYRLIDLIGRSKVIAVPVA